MKALDLRRLLVPALLVGLSASVFAVDLEGYYAATGTNPGDGGEYWGSVFITRTEDTYEVDWEVGTLYFGTGLVVDDVLAVAYVDETEEAVGIVAYRILEDGKRLEGIWCPLYSTILGTEILERQ